MTPTCQTCSRRRECRQRWSPETWDAGCPDHTAGASEAVRIHAAHRRAGIAARPDCPLCADAMRHTVQADAPLEVSERDRAKWARERRRRRKQRAKEGGGE